MTTCYMRVKRAEHNEHNEHNIGIKRNERNEGNEHNERNDLVLNWPILVLFRSFIHPLPYHTNSVTYSYLPIGFKYGV